MERPSKTLFTLKGKISPLFLPLVLLASALFLNTQHLDASNGEQPPPVPGTGVEAPPAPETPPPGRRVLSPLPRRPPGERPAEQATPSAPESPPEIPRRVLPPLPRRPQATPEGEQPPPAPIPGTGVEAPPAPVPPPERERASSSQPTEEQAREQLRATRVQLSRFADTLRGQFDAARRGVNRANDIIDSLERDPGLGLDTYEESGLSRQIKEMSRLASIALRRAEDCEIEPFRLARDSYYDFSSRIESKLNLMRGELNEARRRLQNADTLQRGTITMSMYPSEVITEYNIEDLKTDYGHTRRNAERAGIPAGDEGFQRTTEARDRAVREWETLRESQNFREFSERVTDLDLRQRLEILDQVLRNVEEFYRENRSQARNNEAEAEAALRACEGEEGRRKAQRPPKAEEPFDVSGTWVEMKGDKPVGEWEIRADKRGKITLIVPLQNAPGKVIEYSGSIEGDTITVRHIIKDPALVDPKIPKKVTETAIQEYMPTWDLDLKVSKEGTIEGKKTGFLVNYDPKTLEVAWVKPRFEKDIVLKKKVSCKELLSQIVEATNSFHGALDRTDRPVMEEARRKAEALQRSLKSFRPLPEGCERLEQFVVKVLEDMDTYINYINPPKVPVVKGPPDNLVSPFDRPLPQDAVIGGPPGADNLATDLVSNWELSSGQQASAAVQREANRIAQRIIGHIHRRYHADGWRGGWDTNVAVGWREVAEEWGLEEVASAYLQYHGKCYEWAGTLHGAFLELNHPHRLQYFRGARIWQPGFSPHHAFAIYREGGTYDEGLVIDPWRNNGEPWWGPVSGDDYQWDLYRGG